MRGIPKEVREVFVTAHDIKYKDRIDIQSELQRYCSTAISSTVNLPESATKEEIADIYKYAYDRGLKGVTVYRDGSKKDQPVTFDKKEEEHEFKRPSKLASYTHLVETGDGKMYVTVCEHEGKPLEVFIKLGKSGQSMNTFSEAVGRLISIALQNGIPVKQLTKTLIGINSDHAVWFRFEDSDKRPTQILSIPDCVAQLLEKYYTDIHNKRDVDGEVCMKCGGSMIASEGCFNCRNCGYSKCN